MEEENIKSNTISQQQIQSYMQDENYTIFKAVIEKEIVGFIILQKTDEINVDSVVVKREFRNLGIASKLILKAEKFAKEKDTDVLSLEVSHKNITAYLLYKKLGFIERRTRKKYYADGSDAIEMFKKI